MPRHDRHFLPEAGATFEDQEQRSKWIALLTKIGGRIDELECHGEVLFHGTSMQKAESILDEGMEPTDADDRDLHGMDLGSYWGDLRTAAWYAEDTAVNRGGTPAIVAISARALDRLALLIPDFATLDGPIPGLTRISETGKTEEWWEGSSMTWRQSLDDLGAVAALHDGVIELRTAHILSSIESLDAALVEEPNLGTFRP